MQTGRAEHLAIPATHQAGEYHLVIELTEIWHLLWPGGAIVTTALRYNLNRTEHCRQTGEALQSFFCLWKIWSHKSNQIFSNDAAFVIKVLTRLYCFFIWAGRWIFNFFSGCFLPLSYKGICKAFCDKLSLLWRDVYYKSKEGFLAENLEEGFFFFFYEGRRRGNEILPFHYINDPLNFISIFFQFGRLLLQAGQVFLRRHFQRTIKYTSSPHLFPPAF